MRDSVEVPVLVERRVRVQRVCVRREILRGRGTERLGPVDPRREDVERPEIERESLVLVAERGGVDLELVDVRLGLAHDPPVVLGVLNPVAPGAPGELGRRPGAKVGVHLGAG